MKQKIVPKKAIIIPPQAVRVFKGEIFDVYQWPQQLFDGSQVTFEMLKRPDTVSVMSIVDGKLLVINDVQPHRGERISFPGGRVDDTDVSILEAAKREMREEAGRTFRQWKLIKVWQPQAKIEWFIYLYVAWEPGEEFEPTPDAGEQITVAYRTLDEMKKLVAGKAGHLGVMEEILTDVQIIDDLTRLPEFQGEIIDAAE